MAKYFVLLFFSLARNALSFFFSFMLSAPSSCDAVLGKFDEYTKKLKSSSVLPTEGLRGGLRVLWSTRMGPAFFLLPKRSLARNAAAWIAIASTPLLFSHPVLLHMIIEKDSRRPSERGVWETSTL